MEGLISLIKSHVFIALIIMYLLLTLILKGLNLDKKNRYAQSTNVIWLASTIMINFIFMFYHSKLVNYDNFYNDPDWLDTLIYLIYFVPGLFVTFLLILEKGGLKLFFKESATKKELRSYSPYEKIDNNYYLKDHYRFFRDCVKWISGVFLVLSIVSNYMTIYKLNLYKVQKEIPGTPYLQLFLILGFLFMFEIYNYLNGEEKKTEEEGRRVKKS
ncbi:MAG: hypothetical protein ACRDAS_01345, partial [Cetobacterium sp.]